jgi:hypothetical protein
MPLVFNNNLSETTDYYIYFIKGYDKKLYQKKIKKIKK